MSRRRGRVRVHLLVLLWVWGLLMFVVVDLFRDVDAFDRVRPEWTAYQHMRLAAHRMAGAPCEPGEFTGVVRTARPTRTAGASALRAALDSVDRARGFDALARIAGGAPDPRVRIRAMRTLATRFGSEARPLLVRLAHDAAQGEKARAQAARYLGRTGDGAATPLDALARDGPARVRRGARLGLAELGTVSAVRTLVELAAATELRRVANPEAAAALADALADRGGATAVRIAACRALGRTRAPAALAPLTGVLADRTVSPSVRAAAADALGRLGCREALAAVDQACADPHATVAKQARIARQRVRYASFDSE